MAGRLQGWGAMTETRSGDLIAALDEASLSRFSPAGGAGVEDGVLHRRLRPVRHRDHLALITGQWHQNTGKLALLNSVMLAAAFLGALVFGRFADVAGRKRAYWMWPRS